MTKSSTATQPSSTPDDTRPPSQWAKGTRETIESIAIAFALAFLFKAFEAEAFVIPTGSMAPTLMGRHKDVVCPECGFRYSASGSEEADRQGNVKPGDRFQVIRCTCPVCRFPMSVDPQDPQNQGRNASPSYSGDRIWVSKVPYNLREPERWDVIVFRYPEEPETYYIKRLIGLPNETVRIFHGDIYTKGAGDADYVIQRKPPEKVRVLAQVVHDSDYVAPMLVDNGWPLWWQSGSGSHSTTGNWQAAKDTRSYETDGTSPHAAWLRYRHVVPSESDWFAMVNGRWDDVQQARPQLITDFYAFNTRVVRQDYGMAPSALGLHWVSDLILDCQLDVSSATGTALLDLVAGGRHFRCAIDVASGKAELTIDGLANWQRNAQTAIRGAGSHQVMFANVDRQLLLWVDNKLIAFDQPTTYEALDNDRPQSSPSDAGDLAPVGVGSRGAALKVSHLRVLRDIYYIADRGATMRGITDYRDASPVPNMNLAELASMLGSPAQWTNTRGDSIFDARQTVEFPLAADQFFVLGDNSPASADARLWSSQQYVERDLLVGKALFVYWPHPLELPIPLTDMSIPIVPDLPKMGFIR